VPREGQLGRRDKDSDSTLVEIVNEDSLAVPELSRDCQAPVGWDRLPIEEHRKEVAACTVWTEEDAHEMELRHARLRSSRPTHRQRIADSLGARI
jgi:hypothetical protein